VAILNWKVALRQLHRWVSLAFTLVVALVTVMAVALEEPPEWVFFVPLLPLALLFFTGIYLFVLPYAAKRRRG
jgi:ABC-type polysaccharide/polyol phosphate export permease